MSRPARQSINRFPNLRAGMASISLDTSPRLRARRQAIRDRNRVADAWMNVADALATAIRAVGRSLRKP